MWVDDLVTEIAVEFLNDMIQFTDKGTSFDPLIWDWGDLLEGMDLQICFSFSEDNTGVPVGIYADMVDLTRGDTVMGSGYADGITPKAIGDAIKAARADYIRRKGGD